jgi:hypothetical protein
MSSTLVSSVVRPLSSDDKSLIAMEVAHCFECLDLDNDRKISLSEFIHYMLLRWETYTRNE